MRRREIITLLGGAVTAWPLTVSAQQAAVPVVGFLSSASPGAYANRVAAFQEGLRSKGYVEGQNVATEYRWAEGEYERLAGLAADLVNRKVSVIVSSGGDITSSFIKKATKTIPIVTTIGSDPVVSGLVNSYNHPGGNITAVSYFSATLLAKRFELVCELIPRGTVGALINSDSPTATASIAELRIASKSLARPLIELMAAHDSELDAAFQKLDSMNATAVVVNTDPFFTSRRDKLIALAHRHGLPAIYQWREFVDAGGLMSYGTNVAEVYKQVAFYTAQILQGAKPADLPVMQPTKFELAINLKTAKTLGLTVPSTLLARADEVIE